MLPRLLHLRHLFWQLCKRDISLRYRGSWLGGLWTVLTPLLMLAVYTWVFSAIFKSRWAVTGDAAQHSHVDFALVLFPGLLLLQILADCLNRAPTAIISQPSYVKKVVFPLALLPAVPLVSALFNFLIGLMVWLVFYMLVNGNFPLGVLWLPFILLPFTLLCLGISWALAATGVYIRDIAPVMQLLTTLLTFISPIFFPITALPELMRDWLWLNPLSFVIENARAVMLWGQAPSWNGLLIYSLVSIALAAIGLQWFRLTRRGFADVL
jgi:lipopolysaccharide transport system permease protein